MSRGGRLGRPPPSLPENPVTDQQKQPPAIDGCMKFLIIAALIVFILAMAPCGACVVALPFAL